MKRVSVISKTPDKWNEFEQSIACDELFEAIKAVLNELAREETLCLVTSMHLGPETLAAEAVLKFGEKAKIKLECALPYEEQANDWTEPERDRYYNIIENCDTQLFISTAYTDSCEQKCYDYLVNTADIILLGTTPDNEISELIKNSEKKVISI